MHSARTRHTCPTPRRLRCNPALPAVLAAHPQTHQPSVPLNRPPCRYEVLGTFFERNSASQYGAGLAAGDGSNITIRQSVFTGNGQPSCGQPPLVRAPMVGGSSCVPAGSVVWTTGPRTRTLPPLPRTAPVPPLTSASAAGGRPGAPSCAAFPPRPCPALQGGGARYIGVEKFDVSAAQAGTAGTCGATSHGANYSTVV